ncbi:MAG: C4-type zinc ribbon domain-containing protein [Anaerolineae bacterium]|nr:C4-type zinc ribbon domain-containing protein [Anaerolineae bacterium]
MNLLSLLWQLQTTDTELDEKAKRLQQIDTALADTPNLDAARAAHADAQKRLAHLRAQLHDGELQALALDAKIKSIEERLYSGRVTNPKELDGMEKDLQMHKRQRNALDDKLLALMEAVEQAHARADETARALEHIETTRARELEQLARERDALIARLAELNTAREETRARLAAHADALRLYDQLRQTKAGRAVVQLKRDACGACGFAIPTALIQRVREGNVLVLCSGCGRILVG